MNYNIAIIYIYWSLAMSAYSRPASGTQTGRVWEIADALTRESGRQAKRTEVIGRFKKEGGNSNTASTQYYYWKMDYDARLAANDDNTPPARVAIQVREAGRIVIPVEFRNALKITEGDALAASIVDGEIRLMPQSSAIRKAQDLVRQFVPVGTGLVDSLLAERKTEGRE